MALPVIAAGKLVNYVFVQMTITLKPGVLVTVFEGKEPLLRDAIVREAHNKPFVRPDSYVALDEARLKASVLREVNGLIGPGKVALVTVVKQTPRNFMLLVAFGVLPVAGGFFAAAVVVVATGALRMREAYAALDAPVLVLVAALIPVSDTVQASGGTDLIAGWLSGAFHGLPPLLTLTAMMAVAMAATPFLNNAATVLIVAPIGLGLAKHLGLSPDPFLMAVAVGAGCDFLTPVGHQCNTLVLGPGGYRFGDYARLGAPLTALILVVAPSLIALVWPFAGR